MPGFSLVPRDVPRVETRHRRIVSAVPHPQAVAMLEELRRLEPLSMSGQPPVVWKRADGFLVEDPWGNRFIDWSSGVLVASAGHGRREVIDAVVSAAEGGLLHSYLFAHQLRLDLVRALAAHAPAGLDKVFLLSTGAETIEAAVKLARTRGRRARAGKDVLVGFQHAFHGRTLGAQMMGGIPDLKNWIGTLDAAMVQVPFPDGFRSKDVRFELFEESLAAAGVAPERVCGVLMETYLGGNASFADAEYVRRLRAFCDRRDALLIFDEVQAGFGRTGRYFGFEHYGVRADVVCCGKAVSGSLPLSALYARADVMDQYPPGSMSTTHSANPVCCAAALANLAIIDRERLVEQSARLGEILHAGLAPLKREFPARIGAVHGRGLVAALHMVKPGGIDPDAETAYRIVEAAVQRGVLMFAPVGTGGASVKIAPPLVITEEALRESLDVFSDAVRAVLR